MIKIAPSILSADFSKLGEELQRLEEASADMIHIDVMDGHFVPNLTFGPPVIQSLRPLTKLPFDVHLMINNPDAYIDHYVDAGADIVTVHAECCPHLHRTIQRIKQRGKKAGVSLNPATSLSTLDWILEEVDMVLIMTVNPGFGGQRFIDTLTGKIREVKQRIQRKGLATDLEVDGGITLDNIYKVTEAGANMIVAGSTVFNADDTAKIIKDLKNQSYKGKV